MNCRILVFLIVISSCSGISFVNGQTFNGVGGLNFPPVGSTGVTESQSVVSGVGVLGSCNFIENVTIDLDHSWCGDIALILIAPDGTFIELSSGNGGAADNYTNTVFTDNASINIVSGFPPFTGDFMPEGRQNVTIFNPYPNTGTPGTFTFANTFNGVNADGNWNLYLNDYVGGDVGFLNSWSITFSNTGTSFTVDVGPDLTICSGDDVTLTANNTAANPIGYLWSNTQTGTSITLVDITTSETYTVTVTDQSGCTVSDEVNIIVDPAPVGNPITYVECETSPGLAVFDLSSIASGIGSGLPVTFFSDMNMLNPITNITNYVSGNTVIYAVVTQGGCNSLPVPITLEVVSSSPSSFGMNIVQDVLCGSGLLEVQFTLPSPGVYTYNYELNCTDGNQSTSITTSANPIFFAVSTNCTLNITSITNVSTGCSTIFSPPLTDVIVVGIPPQIVGITPEVCQGESVDLADFVTGELGATLTFHSASPPTPSNELPSSIVSPSSTTFYYVQSILNGCDAEATIFVTVLPGGPSFTTNLTLCENSTATNLDPFITPTSLTGTWSGTGVNGNFFDPSGLSGPILLTFNPDNVCYDPGTLAIDVTPDQVLNLLTTDICTSDAVFDLNTLEDPAFTNGTWSGPGVTGDFIDPSTLSGTVSVTFTPADPCISAASTVINILPPPVPLVDNNIAVCFGATIELTDYLLNATGFDVNVYIQLPAIPSNEVSSTSLVVVNSSTYYVKFTNADGCFGVAPLVVNVLPGGIPDVQTATICQVDNTYNLDQLNDPLAGPGTWTGTGVTANILDLTNQSGVISLTFVPDNACFEMVDSQVEIVIPSDPILGTDELCSTSGNFNLSNLVDPNFPIGNWSGPGVSNNIFDPMSYSGTITLTFEPDGFCINSNSTDINVIPSQVPELTSISVCETTVMVDLNTLEDPAYIDGVWSGSGVSGNIFETVGVVGANVVTFTSNELCVLPANATINITSQQTPQILPFTLCEAADPVDLSSFVDPTYPQGVWSGPGVANGFFDPEGLSGMLQLDFDAAASCTLPAVTSATITSAPIVSEILTVCDQTTQTYTVQFNISSGDPTTYLVNGMPSGATYTSPGIGSQANYLFTVTDVNLCEVITIQGSKNCDCITDAGTMNFANTPIMACISDTVTAVFNNDASNDGNDRLLFILHDNAGSLLGNVLAQSTQPIFTFPPNGVLGTTYYISAVMADEVGLDSVNYSDPCLSIAAGIPIVFYEPEMNVIQAINVCINFCNEIVLTMNGVAPYTFVIESSSGNTVLNIDTVTTLNSLYRYTFCPVDFGLSNEEVTVKIIDFSDKNCDGRLANDRTSFTVFPARTQEINATLCQGETLLVNGKIYSETNPKGVEVVPTIMPGQCDSIIVVDLNFVQPSTFELKQQLCTTQSLVVNGTTYDNANPKGIEIFLGANALGCDSIVNIDLTFIDEIVYELNQTLCAGESIIVNGVKYDASNTNGTEVIPSVDGTLCDSIIMVALTFEQPKTNLISEQVCDGDNIIINGKVYDITNPMGMDTLYNAASNGCDSIIYVNLQFLMPTSLLINDTLCAGESLFINGETYDANNPTGSFVLTNANGCDSTVTVQLDFFADFVDTIYFSIKRGETIVYNNEIFDENRLQALIVDPVLSSNGCTKYMFVVVKIEQEFITASFNSSPESCPGLNDGQIIIQSVEGCSNYVITVNGSNIDGQGFPIVLADLAPGNYQLLITGDTGCSYAENIVVAPSTSVDFDVQNDFFELNKGVSSVLDPVIFPIPNAIQWEPIDFLSCADCLSPQISEQAEDISYTIYLTNADGCIYRHTIKVVVKEEEQDIVFPNIFAPNGNTGNSEWSVLFTDNQRVSLLSVYDRWGNKVFNVVPSDDQTSVSWNGKINNQAVLPGVYIYLAEVKNSNGNISYLSGDITVVR